MDVADLIIGGVVLYWLWFTERAYQTFYGRWRVRGKACREGVIVYVKRGWRKVECGRVGFDRAASANPATDFDEQIGVVMARSRQRASSLNAVQRNWRNG